MYVELENLKHGVLHDNLEEVSGIQIRSHWIGLKKLAYEYVNYNIVCTLYPEIPPPQKKKTFITQK